jgi:thiamine-phosphate pyrophosphorylase
VAVTDAELGRIVREFEALFADGTPTDSIHPDFVADLTRSRRPEAGMYRGVRSATVLFDSMRDSVDELAWRGTIVERPKEDVALLRTELRARGRASGIDISGSGAMLWRLEDGKLRESALFQSVDEARAFLRRQAKAERLAATRLYFVCEARPGGRDPRPLLEAAIRGGAGIIQLRDKELDDPGLVEAARPFRETADAGGAIFILNDRPDLVEACGADGVHIGQDDLAVAAARRAAGEAALIGLSTHTFAQVEDASNSAGIARPDQISVGPVWETPTKEGRPATGLGLVEFAARESTIPWFAIGGIDTETAADVAAAGARRAVVVRAIRGAADPEAAARSIAGALAAASGENPA